MKKRTDSVKILLITMLIFVMVFVMLSVTMAWAYPLDDELEILYEKRGGTYITVTYYEHTLINSMSGSIFHPLPWRHGKIPPGVVELGGAIHGKDNAESNSETHSDFIIFREGPANGYEIIATLEQNPKDPEEYDVIDEINNYLLIKTESQEGWVEKSQVQRKGIMEPLSPDFIRIKDNHVDFHQGPSSSEKLLGQVVGGEIYSVLEDHENWLKIQKSHQVGWIYKESTEEVEVEIPEEWYQFFELHNGVPSGILEEEINQLFHQFLSDQGFSQEIGKSFLEAGQVTELNEVYLVGLALENYREATKFLYEGLVVDRVAGSSVEPRTVYSFYGIGALEEEPERSAGETAYVNGWFTREEAIVEGAQWILKNHFQENRDTLYAMVMGPYLDVVDNSLIEDGSADFEILSHGMIQSIEKKLQENRKIGSRIKEIYDEFDLKNQRFNIPVFEKEWYWPVPGFQRLSSEFGYRKDPFEGDIRFHRAIDIPGPRGTPIVAVKAGVVTKNFRGESYGNLIEIDHGEGITTRYGHNAENFPKVGDFVEKGDLIAIVGSTGRSTGPHLHFELRLNNQAMDPLPWLTEGN